MKHINSENCMMCKALSNESMSNKLKDALVRIKKDALNSGLVNKNDISDYLLSDGSSMLLRDLKQEFASLKSKLGMLKFLELLESL